MAYFEIGPNLVLLKKLCWLICRK